MTSSMTTTSKKTKATLTEDLQGILASQGMRLTRDGAERVMEAVLETVSMALVGGHEIEVRDYFTIKLDHAQARFAKNPRTGAPVFVPPRVKARVKVLPLLMQRINANISPAAPMPCPERQEGDQGSS